MMLYPRDASWHPRSKAGGGRRGVYHRARAEDPARAACSPNIVLVEDMGVERTELEEALVCRRCARGPAEEPDAGELREHAEGLVVAKIAKIAKAEPCCHPRCGNIEWHHADPDGGFTEECEPFTLAPGQCECRRPARYGTKPDPSCKTCGGSGYLGDAP